MGNVGIKGKTHLVMAGLLVLALTLGIAYATPVEISKSVPGSITLANILPLGDVDGDGKVDLQDLPAFASKLDTRSTPGASEDINNDGIIDVLDLATVAQNRGHGA